MQHKPLDDLELVELLWACFPEKFSGEESNEDWDAAMELTDEFGGFDELADLLGRVVMLAPQIEAGFSGKLYHALVQKQGKHLVAIVKREAATNHAAEQGEGA